MKKIINNLSVVGYSWLLAGLLVATPVSFAVYVWAEKEIDRLNEMHHLTFLAANELLQSSEALNNMARSYVVTGDPRYKQQFQSIMDIRDGKAPRPEGFSTFYWVLPKSDENDHASESHGGETIALEELVHQLPFSEGELQIFAQAKNQSDALTIAELKAIRLSEEDGPNVSAKKAAAVQMLFESHYEQEKSTFIKSIKQFSDLSNARAEGLVNAAKDRAANLRFVLIATTLAFGFLLFRAYQVVLKRPEDSLDRAYAIVDSVRSARKIHPALFTLAMIALAAAFRIWPLSSLETKVVWLTFYPAVMAAAIYGGLLAGLFGTVSACLVAIFLGPFLVGAPFISVSADWISMGVFVITGTMISGLSESMLRANARASQSQRAAETASRAKSDFLSSMSHELRTPLNAIIGLSHLLQKDASTPKQREKLKKIIHSGKHLLSVINDILDMSKIEANKIVLEEVEFDIHKEVHNICCMLADRAESKKLKLVEDVDDRFREISVAGDAFRLAQILINLINNAIKFTDQGQVTLRANIDSESDDRLMLRFEVEDTGKGLSDEQQSRLFKDFEQADVTTARVYGGTGLGLAICRRLARLMGGDIGVRSALGQGSTFWVTLNFKRASGNAVALAQEASKAPPLRKGARILLAEDNEMSQEVAKEMLEDFGLMVDVADNGQQVLEKVRQAEYDLILMDIQMPEMDGLEATRKIRGFFSLRNLPILAMTANTFEDDREKCEVAGMNGFVSKPVDPQHLRSILAEWIPGDHSDSEQLNTALAPHPVEEAEIDPSKHINTQAGLQNFDGKLPTYQKFLLRFAQSYANDTEKISAAIETGDVQSAQRIAHSLKGVSAMIGAEQVSALASEIEHAIRDNAMNEIFFDKLALLNKLLKTALAEIKAMGIVENNPVSNRIEPEHVKRLVARLEYQLEHDFYKAEATWQELAPLAERIVGKESSSMLGDLIKKYEFPDALSLLRRILVERTVSHEHIS